MAFAVLIISCNNPKPDFSSESSSESVINPKVYLIQPQDGDTVISPFVVKMGVQGMSVEPTGMSRIGFGHHHILINRKYWTINEIIPLSDTIYHYGNGETEAKLDLESGKYMLSLQFADGVFMSYGEQMSASINIIVQ